MAAFPAYAKLLFIGGYAEEPASAVRRSESEDRFVKQLQTVSKVLVARAVVYRLGSKVDKANFKTFVDVTLHRGADYFDWTDPADDAVKLARIVNGKVKYTATRKVMDIWRAEFQVETYV